MDTQLACLTPPGKAAIATLSIRGPLAWQITRQLFRPNKGGGLPDEPNTGKYWYGKIGKECLDEVILAAPAGRVELHCHGGVEVVRMIQELFAERGAAIVPWQQFCDSLHVMLAHAPTVRTAAIILDQIHGARLTDLSAEQRQRFEQLIPLGRHLVEPWKIVIAGAPNVGKSSLMNALAGYTRSIVSPTPGTTRDVVTAQLAIDGWPVEVTDTAGIRAASSTLEQQGIDRAHRAVREADLRFWLLDGSEEPAFPDDANAWHFVINKIDLSAGWDWERVSSALRISAQTQAGLAELCEKISQELVPYPPVPGEAVPISPTMDGEATL